MLLRFSEKNIKKTHKSLALTSVIIHPHLQKKFLKTRARPVFCNKVSNKLKYAILLVVNLC